MTQIVFLTYINRSGSTFLINQLSKTKEISVCPESEIIYDVLLGKSNFSKNTSEKKVKRIIKRIANDYKFLFWDINEKELEECFVKGYSFLQVFVEILKLYTKKTKPNSTVIIYKHTWSIRSLQDIVSNLNKEIDFQWIVLIRDVRAVFNSQKKTKSPYSGEYHSTNLYSLTHDWNNFINKANLAKDDYRCLIIKYEDMILENLKILESIGRFLTIDISMPGGHQENQIDTFLPKQFQGIHSFINLPPQEKFINKWQKELSEKEKNSISFLCYNNLGTYNYNTGRSKKWYSYFPYLFLIFIKYILSRLSFHPKS